MLIFSILNYFVKKKVDLSTPWPEGWGLLEVHPFKLNPVRKDGA
jgi:hypothetical protein